MIKHRIAATALLAAVAIFSGCASPGYYPAGPVQAYPAPAQTYPAPIHSYPASSPSYAYSGTIDSIQVQQGGANDSMGVGTVTGGVVGGLLGNQVGGGRGKKAATIVGAIGGAMIGHEMERNVQGRDAYQIGVRLDNGAYQTIVQDNIADLSVGSRVRVENNRVYRY
jgi:outer membrane lipoprotein SlyB